MVSLLQHAKVLVCKCSLAIWGWSLRWRSTWTPKLLWVLLKGQASETVRHLRTQALWLQEVETEKRANFMNVDGACNPADAMTKYISEDVMNKHMRLVPAIF